MPKSKHRRKPKGTAQTAVATSSQGASSEEAQSAPPPDAPKKKSVGIVQFFKQVRDEGQKVTWTTRSETMVSTLMVLVMVAIASLFFFLIDQILRTVIPQLLSLGF